MINIIDEITTLSAMSPAPKPTFSRVESFCVCTFIVLSCAT